MKRKTSTFHPVKKALTLLLCLVMTFTLAACGAQNSLVEQAAEETPTQDTQETQEQEELVEESPAYPYTDEEGRIRYQFMLNGNLASLPHEPYSMPGKKGAFFPLEDVLNILGVAVVKTDDGTSVGSSINGNIFKATGGQATMTYGNSTIKAADSDTFPTMVDGVLYVPSFFFMKLSDNSIVDFSADGTCCTLDTDIVIDPDNSGPIGITVEDLKPEAAKITTGGNVSSGFHPCSQCGGLGGKTEFVTEMRPNPIGGAPTSTVVSRFVICSRCGGTGHE